MTKRNTINWTNFSVLSPEFKIAEQSSSISQLLHEYFSKNKVVSEKFVTELANDYPSELLKAIKVNRSFLINEHFNSLSFLDRHSNKKLSDNYKFFSKLKEIENQLFDDFSLSIKNCSQFEILETLVWVSLWFEEKRASLFGTQLAHIAYYDISPVVEIINFFINHYLFHSKDKIKHTVFHKGQDVEVLAKIIPEAKQLNNLNDHLAWTALHKAEIYLNFLKTTIEIYCFDPNYDIELNNRVACLKYINENKLKRWFIENEKLRYWYESHREIATYGVKKKIEEDPNFIKDKSGSDYQMNYEGAIRSAIARKIANDFCVDKSELFDVPTSSLLKVLNGFVVNSLGRFVQPMDILNYHDPENWLDNIVKNVINHSKIKTNRTGSAVAAYPTRFSDKTTLKEIIHFNVKQSESYSDSLINLISFDIEKYNYVDRLKPLLNLNGKPYIKLNDFYFAFTAVLGETNSQVNILFNAMESNWLAHSKVESIEVQKMERELSIAFKNAGFENVDCSVDYHEKGKRKGNFDVLVYEKGVLLLIELKRSKIRIHLSDVHEEYENSLLKAANQLEKAEKYIRENFPICKKEYFNKLNITENSYGGIKFYPFVVSTSFEYDHTCINEKYFKLSHFELVNVLSDEIEPINGNRLEGLIQKLLRNEFWEPIEVNCSYPDFNRYTLTMPL